MIKGSKARQPSFLAESSITETRYATSDASSFNIFSLLIIKKRQKCTYLLKIGMIAVNIRYITAISPQDIYKFITRGKKGEKNWR